MSKQLEFLFTEEGANQAYLQHQRNAILNDWQMHATGYPFRANGSRGKWPDLRTYTQEWIDCGKANYFRILWGDYYFKNVVERQTSYAKRRFEENPLFTNRQSRPNSYVNWPAMRGRVGDHTDHD